MNDQTRKTNEDIVTYSQYDRKKRNKMIIRAVSIIAVALVLVAAISFVLIKKFFVVGSVVINGTSVYSSAEIRDSSGIKDGDVIFFVRSGEVRNRLMSRYPYIRDVTVEKEYPSGINIVITEEEPVYYFEYDGEYFVITREMKILEKYTEEERVLNKFRGITPVYVPPVYKSIVSGKLEFISAKDTRHVKDILYTVYGWNEYGNITNIDVHNRFDIRILYDNRITIKLGSKSNLTTKLAFAEGVIMAYSDRAYGEIIIDSTNEAVARITDPAGEESEDRSEDS